jgi:hypothetical protein
MDGNFVCIHRMLKNQEGDLVWLKGNGEGFMTSKGPYDAYLENAVEDKEVRTDSLMEIQSYMIIGVQVL